MTALRRRFTVRRSVLLSAVLLSLTAFVATASSAAIRTRTVACATRVVTISFDPRRGVDVRSSADLLGSASFANADLSHSCKSVPEPADYLDPGLGKEIRRVVRARCTTPASVHLHVNPITENGAVVGSNLLVGMGSRLTVIASAVLKNKGDPKASGLYVARRYCSLL